MEPNSKTWPICVFLVCFRWSKNHKLIRNSFISKKNFDSIGFQIQFTETRSRCSVFVLKVNLFHLESGKTIFFLHARNRFQIFLFLGKLVFVFLKLHCRRNSNLTVFAKEKWNRRNLKSEFNEKTNQSLETLIKLKCHLIEGVHVIFLSKVCSEDQFWKGVSWRSQSIRIGDSHRIVLLFP